MKQWQPLEVQTALLGDQFNSIIIVTIHVMTMYNRILYKCTYYMHAYSGDLILSVCVSVETQQCILSLNCLLQQLFSTFTCVQCASKNKYYAPFIAIRIWNIHSGELINTLYGHTVSYCNCTIVIYSVNPHRRGCGACVSMVTI